MRPRLRPLWRRCPRGVVAAPVVLVLALLALPTGAAGGTLEMAGAPAIAGRTTPGPLTATTTSSGVGSCASAATGSAPTSSRGSVALVEPATCPSRTRLAFLPMLEWTNGFAVPAGHVDSVRIDLLTVGGATAMLRNVRVYVQAATGLFGILTTTPIQIRNGVVTTASTSPATLPAATLVGLGIQCTLVRPAVLSTASLTLLLVVTLDDGNLPRVVVDESLDVAMTY